MTLNDAESVFQFRNDYEVQNDDDEPYDRLEQGRELITAMAQQPRDRICAIPP
jgi:hypothetical protein